MSRKNFKVDTAQDGQTAKSDNKHPFVYKNINVVEKTNVPTGKVTTLEDKKKRREAREKQYRDFRITALKRRAERMNIPKENIQELVEKLCEQLDAPKQYTILVMYDKAIRGEDGVKHPLKDSVNEIVKNNNIAYLMKGDTHMFIEGDAKVLALLREIMPPGVDIHPYAKKMPSVLPAKDPPTVIKKPQSKADKKSAATAAKTRRKTQNKLAAKHRKENKQARKQAKIAKLTKKSNELKKAA